MAESNERASSSSSSSLEETIRRCVRDEMRSLQGSRSGVQSLLDRTRSLIRESSFSTASELRNDRRLTTNMQATTPSSNSTGLSAFVSRASPPSAFNQRLTAPGHPYRPLRRRGQKEKKVTATPKAVHLIEARDKLQSNMSDSEAEDLAGQSTLSFRENMVILKGEFDLVANHTEDQIRQELVDVFKTKLPLIGKNDFEFVKRDRQTIVRPAVKQGHKWDFRHVKNLCGQGRLYVQLKIPSNDLAAVGQSDLDDNDLSLPTSLLASSCPTSNTSSATLIASQPNLMASMQPSTSDHEPIPVEQSINDNRLEELKAIFPSVPVEQLVNTLQRYQTVAAAAEALTDSDSPSECQEVPKAILPQSAAQILAKLRNKVELGAEKLKLDEDDMLLDVLHYYKNPQFDPEKGLRMCLKGNSAIDTGGVLRQVYTEVFSAIAEGKDGLALFRGDPRRKVPVFSNAHVLTGIFEVLGKVIAHSLIQGGPGFPYLAPVIYSYISTGNPQMASFKVSVLDIKNQALSVVIDKIRDAKQTEIEELNNDAEFMQLLDDCGERRLLNTANKLDIAQSLILTNVLTKNISLLDQMRKGLSLLGLLKEMEGKPHLFEPFFVHQGERVTPEYVKELIKIMANADDRSVAIRCEVLLMSFLDSCTEDELSRFLGFSTGSHFQTSSLVTGSIHVYFMDTPAIFASTCLMELKIPIHFADQSQNYFNTAMQAMIKEYSFNTH